MSVYTLIINILLQLNFINHTEIQPLYIWTTRPLDIVSAATSCYAFLTHSSREIIIYEPHIIVTD